VASAAPYANLHVDPDTTMPASHPSCCPTNSVKALKAKGSNIPPDAKWSVWSQVSSSMQSNTLVLITKCTTTKRRYKRNISKQTLTQAHYLKTAKTYKTKPKLSVNKKSKCQNQVVSW